MKSLKKFWNDETGLELSEYAVAAALVAGGLALTAFTGLGKAIADAINSLAKTIAGGNNGVPPPPPCGRPGGCGN